MRQNTPVVLTVIGIVLVLLMLLVGAWALTSFLQERERAEHAAAVAHLERQQADAEQQKRELERQEQEKRKALELMQPAPKFDPDELIEMMSKTDENEEARAERAREHEDRARGEGRWSGKAGRGGSEGRGYSSGPPPGMIGRPLRQYRWTIFLPHDDPNVYFKKLVTLKAFLVIPDGSSKTSFRICENLEKSPFVFAKIDRAGIDQHNRLWFLCHRDPDGKHIASAMSLPQVPDWIAFFLPHDLEQELVRQECNYKKLSEDELNLKSWITIFDVDRRGDVWDVRVRFQGPRKK